MCADLYWSPYDSHGTTSRVREFVKRGAVEFELCCEGGSFVIRRTERHGGKVTITETARGNYRRAVEAWGRVARGDLE